MPLYRVHKMRRRDRRGRTWLLWWHDPADAPACRTHTLGPMCKRLAERHREAWQADLNGFPDGVGGQRAAAWVDFCDAYFATVQAQGRMRTTRAPGPPWVPKTPSRTRKPRGLISGKAPRGNGLRLTMGEWRNGIRWGLKIPWALCP